MLRLEINDFMTDINHKIIQNLQIELPDVSDITSRYQQGHQRLEGTRRYQQLLPGTIAEMKAPEATSRDQKPL